jgi:hypothetical protein
MWGGGERGKVDLQEGNTEEKNKGYVVFIAISAPLIYTAP